MATPSAKHTSSNTTKALTPLQALEAQQAKELEALKEKQAIARKTEVQREHRAAAAHSKKAAVETANKEASNSHAQQQTHVTQLKPSSTTSPVPVATQQSRKTDTATLPPTQAVSESGNLNSTHGIYTSTSSPIPTSTPLGTTPSHVNNTSSRAGSQSSPLHSGGLSAGHTAILVLGLLFLATAVAWILFRFWKRRRASTNTLPVNKVKIKGPFKKSTADEDDEEVFGGPAPLHTSIAFESLGIIGEKTTGYQHEGDAYAKQPFQAKRLTVTPALLSSSPAPQSASSHTSGYTESIISPTPFSTTAHLSTQPERYEPSMEGKTFLVERTYEATLADELVLSIGDRVQVNVCYDDGWCLGKNLDSDRHREGLMREGVLPRDCLSAKPLDVQSTPTLPPLDLGEYYTGIRTSALGPPMTPFDRSEVIESFPVPPASRQYGRGNQRVSSLLANRDAQLLLELGDALGNESEPSTARNSLMRHHT